MNKLSCIAVLAACAPSSGTPPAQPVEPIDRGQTIVSGLVGAWQGRAEGTPMGDFPMALRFAAEPDGAVHARLDGEGGMYLDFRFHRAGTTWLLTEQGAIPKLGVQSHTLMPTGPGVWSDQDVRVEVDERGDRVTWSTSVHGRPHAVFHLVRQQSATSAAVPPARVES
jgi:hypothetical protein